MPFANEDIRFGYDLTYENVTQIGENPDAAEDDKTFEAAVKALIRWRKGEQEYPFVAPPAAEAPAVRDWSRQEIIDRIIAESDARGIPRRLGIGAGIAESGLRQYAERNGKWPDVSYGIGQQIVLFAPVGDRSDTPANRELVKQWLFDPANAIPLMIQKLAGSFHDPNNPGTTEDERVMMALYRYNTGNYNAPGGIYAGNVGNYQRALAQADRMLAAR